MPQSALLGRLTIVSIRDLWLRSFDRQDSLVRHLQLRVYEPVQAISEPRGAISVRMIGVVVRMWWLALVSAALRVVYVVIATRSAAA